MFLVDLDRAGRHLERSIQLVLNCAGKALFDPDSSCERAILAQVNAKLKAVLRVYRVTVVIEGGISSDNVAAVGCIAVCGFA